MNLKKGRYTVYVGEYPMYIQVYSVAYENDIIIKAKLGLFNSFGRALEKPKWYKLEKKRIAHWSK